MLRGIGLLGSCLGCLKLPIKWCSSPIVAPAPSFDSRSPFHVSNPKKETFVLTRVLV